MHEATLVRALVRQVLDLAREHEAQRVRRIVVRLGVLGHAQSEPLQWHFTQQTAGTLIAGAALDVITTDELIDVVLDRVDLERVSAAPGG
jgi:Zn finger protein HypA/HybF involved in hydrogenase expression